MKMLRNLIYLLAASLVIAACRKEQSTELGAPPTDLPTAWEFTESGALFNGELDSATVLEIQGLQTMFFTGLSDDLDGVIVLQIVAPTITTGVYTNPNIFFLYEVNGAVVFQNSPSQSDAFSITISSINSEMVTGTFSGIAEDASGNRKNIENGKFTAVFKKTGNEIIEEETGDYFPFSGIWTYGNTLDPENDTVRISRGSDTTINGETAISLLNEASGQVKYYSKSNGEYYEYIVNVPTAGALLEPVKLLLLRDDAAENDTWETDPYIIDFSGSGIDFSITAKIVSTVTRAGFTEIINGVQYKNLVEVSYELYTEEPDGSYVNANTGYRTIYAKGIGIVFYQQLNTGTDWTIRYHTILPD